MRSRSSALQRGIGETAPIRPVSRPPRPQQPFTSPVSPGKMQYVVCAGFSAGLPRCSQPRLYPAALPSRYCEHLGQSGALHDGSPEKDACRPREHWGPKHMSISASSRPADLVRP